MPPAEEFCTPRGQHAPVEPCTLVIFSARRGSCSSQTDARGFNLAS